jgi:HJR/Mrr/RecB family endonuclease
VVAGRFHWKGTHAVLVSNAGYTASAEELALSTEVKLLHHDDLVKLKEILHK